MAMMVVVYPMPENVEAFDRHYFDVHVPLAKQLPGLKKYEVSHGPVRTPTGGPAIHRIGTLSFDSLEALHSAFASPQGQAAAADRRTYAPDESGVRMFIFDAREV